MYYQPQIEEETPLVDFAHRIELNEEELMFSVQLAAKRCFYAWKKGLDPDNRKRKLEEQLADSIIGALGETVVYKFKGQYFDGNMQSFKGPDIGRRTQIRTTNHVRGGLNVYAHDNPNHVFLLVTGGPFVWWVVGWLLGSESKLDDYRIIEPKRKAGYYFCVPQTEVHPYPRNLE